MAESLALPFPRFLPHKRQADPCAASSADEAWLRMDRPENRMVITAVMRMGRQLDAEAIKALITQRMLRHPRFGHALVRGRHSKPDGRLNLDAHVKTATLERGDHALQKFLAKVMEEPLPHDLPLWRLYVLRDEEDQTVLVWRIHHALADGIALLRILLEAADGPAVAGPSPHALEQRKRSFLILRGAYSLAKLLLIPPDARTSLKNHLSGTKQVAFSEPMPVERVKQIAHAHGVTINDILLSALAAGLHAQLNGRARNVRAIIPVDLRAGKTDESLGNRFGLVFLSLPVGALSPRERLSIVKRRMDRIKHQPEAFVAFRILELIGAVSNTLSTVAVRIFGAKASMVVTNVAGPLSELSLSGAPVKEMLFWVPQAAGIGVGVSLFSYAGTVRLGVVSDRACLPDAEALVTAFTGEIDRLETGRS